MRYQPPEHVMQKLYTNNLIHDKGQQMNAKRYCRQLRHDALVDMVAEELEARGYSPTFINIDTCYNINGVYGQIDLYAIKDNYILLFEIKCTKNHKTIKKAIEQTDRAENKYFNFHSPTRRVFKLMAYYDQRCIDGWGSKWLKKINI